MSSRYDLLIIGGGIHGAGIARDAAGRGLNVALCEAGDFAGATSSASSKLIHGGLRYLEYGDVRLVRDALHERETLLRIAPHITRPLRFVLPHVPHLRPAWMIRLGLVLYDYLNLRSTLAASQGVDLRTSPYGAPLAPAIRKGFVYSDGWIDDARLVILNLQSAAQRGAHILSRTRFVSALPGPEGWQVQLATEGDEAIQVQARVLINAAGPWVDAVRAALSPSWAARTRLVKGSHIVVPALYSGGHAYILQAEDRRVVFLLPFAGAHTLIGTTDMPVTSPAAPAHASEEEVQYLCAAASRFLREPITPDRVVHSFAGVRALLDDGHANASAVSRDYALLLETLDDAGVLSIVGGKLTTYRVLAEKALDKLQRYFPEMRGKSWTGNEPLPGGDLSAGGMSGLLVNLRARYPHLPAALLEALAHRHGTLTTHVLSDADSEADLGMDFGAGLYTREVDYFIDREWACTADDVLWRRTKAGLQLDERAHSALSEYMEARIANRRPA